jgi:hypothetical protein
MTHSTGGGGVFGRGPNGTLREAFIEVQQSEGFREYPLQVRAAFQRVEAWLPPKQAALPITEIDGSFARMLRDRAARERGWKFGNYTLLLLQATINAAVEAGTLPTNRVKKVPKILPPSLPTTTFRRRIRPARHPISSPASLSKKESGSA